MKQARFCLSLWLWNLLVLFWIQGQGAPAGSGPAPSSASQRQPARTPRSLTRICPDLAVGSSCPLTAFLPHRLKNLDINTRPKLRRCFVFQVEKQKNFGRKIKKLPGNPDPRTGRIIKNIAPQNKYDK
jgi:hypothetical protein